MFFMSDYYVIADVKMLKFFTDMSVLSMWVIGMLVVLSVLYKNFWCRYLCPYGALLGLLSKLSPVKVRRTEASCTHCGACTRSCPALIDVEKTETVNSAECFGCMTCVSSCPSAGALDMTAKTGKTIRVLKPAAYVALLVGLFYLVIGIGVATGKWHSQIPVEQYERLIPRLNELTH